MFQTKTTLKEFRVAAVSSNKNSFGLNGVVILAEDGEAYEVGAAYPPERGARVFITRFPDGALVFAQHGFEAPRKLTAPPQAVIDEVFVA